METSSDQNDFDVKSIGSSFSEQDEDILPENGETEVTTGKNDEINNVRIQKIEGKADQHEIKPNNLTGDPQETTPESASSLKDAKNENQGFGMLCEIKETWKDSYTGESEDDSGRYAVVVRYKISTVNTPGRTVIDKLVIQSPVLKPLLSKVFADLEGITVGLKRFALHRPLDPFFHRWDRFRKSIEEENDELTKSHARLIYDILLKDFSPDFADRDDYLNHGVMRWNLFWTLFPPGELVINRTSEADLLYQVEKTQFRDDQFIVVGKSLEYDGESFKYIAREFVTEQYTGTKPITALDVYPVRFHADADILGKLTARGRRVESLKGYHYKSYQGRVLWPVMTNGSWGPNRVTNGRIIIDAGLFDRVCPGVELPDTPLRNAVTKDCLSDDECAICSPFLKGYSLRERDWGRFHIDNIEDIAFDETAFNNVVVPEGYQDLISALTQGHANAHGSSSSSKERDQEGHALVILLSGEPGIGRRSTAKSVAEQMRLPLYSFSAAELGSETASAETTLAEIFNMASLWRAILLVDDAEVLLQYRKYVKGEKAKLASEFRRQIESHEGIVFFISRPLTSLDKAFQSQIHLHLSYPAPDRTARMRIWRKLIGLQLSSLDDLDKFDFEALAERKMNGAEIKRLIQAAQLVAIQQKNALGPGHIQTVLRITQIGQELETQVGGQAKPAQANVSSFEEKLGGHDT